MPLLPARPIVHGLEPGHQQLRLPGSPAPLPRRAARQPPEEPRLARKAGLSRPAHDLPNLPSTPAHPAPSTPTTTSPSSPPLPPRPALPPPPRPPRPPRPALPPPLTPTRPSSPYPPTDSPAPLRSAHSITGGDIVYCVYVARRKRQRPQIVPPAPVREPRDRMARVQASDETWAAFRAQLGVTPVSVALGRLVEREVARTARRSASDADAARVALDDARELAGELATLITRLERLAETPASHASGAN